MEPYWITAAGQVITPSEMDSKHIENTIKCLNGEGKSVIPDRYCGLRRELWLEIFNNELSKRNFLLIFN